MPALARLDRRQEAFAVRLASRSEGPHGRLLQSRVGLGLRLREAIPEAEGGRVEQVRCSRGLVFPKVAIIPVEHREKEEKEDGVKKAMDEASGMSEDTDTIWTEGSKLEDGRVGAGIAWFDKGEDKKGKIKVIKGTTERQDRDEKGKKRTMEDTGP